MVAVRLRAQLTGAARESLAVVEPGGGIEEPFGTCAIGVELGMYVRADLEQDLVRVMWRRDALPRPRPKRGQALRACSRVRERKEDWRAARNARIGAECAAQLDARDVRQDLIDQEHVGLGAPRALQRVTAGALLKHGIPGALKQVLEPARYLGAVAGEEYQREARCRSAW